MSVQEIVQPELDYRQITTSVPTYRYRKYVPENGTTVGLDSNSNVLHVFRFGAGFVFNFAKSRLQFSIEVTMSPERLLLMNPELQIAAIRVETDNGIVLLDQQNWHAISKVIRMANLRLEDVEKEHQINMPAAATSATAIGQIAYDSCRVNDVALTVTGADGASQGFMPSLDLGWLKRSINRGLWERGRNNLAAVTGQTGTGNGTYSAAYLSHGSIMLKLWSNVANGAVALQFGQTKYREYNSFAPFIPIGGFIQPTDTANHAGTAIAQTQKTAYVNFDVKLGDVFPHTLLKQAQDMWFGGHSIVMSIWWMPTYKWGMVVKDFLANASSADLGKLDTTALTTTNIQFTSSTSAKFSYPVLQVACQDSPSIVAAVQQQILGPGLTLPVQHMEFVRMATNVGTSTTSSYKYYQTFKLSLTQGSTLLRAYHAFAIADTTGLHYDEIQKPSTSLSSDGTAVVPPFVDARTYVNAQPLTDGSQDSWEIYYTRRKLYEACQLKGWDSNFKYYGEPYINDFTGFADMIDKTPSSGLALSAPTDYQVEFTINQYADYLQSVFVFLRFLRLSAAGVSISSA